MKCILLISVFITYLEKLSFVASYCLEEDFPIVYYDSFSNQNNPDRRSSYFGYSAIMYPGSNVDESWVQISAPRAYSNVVNLTEPGMISKCSIYGPCVNIDVDEIAVPSNKPREIEFPQGVEFYFEDRNKGWLGVSMDINLEHNVSAVCGHRWTNYKNPTRDIYSEGVCYWNNFNSRTYNKLLPLLLEKKDYGGGLAGMSVHFPASEKNLLLGAPGLYEARGMVLKVKDYEDKPNIASRRRKRSTDGSIPFGDVIVPSYNKKIEEKDAYLGYSVTSGRFFNKKETLYVSAMPRKNYKGSVVVFNIEDANKNMKVVTTLDGDLLGEYFGAALASCDVNGDGYDDLIVGSPHYSSRYFDEGRVQVFYGQKQSNYFVKSSLHGSMTGKRTNSQYGLSVASLGDIDQDGYGDVAIGAPFENEGTGCVYIYMGSFEGLRSVYSQKLIGKDVDISIKGFGISIAKPADIDNNKYKDVIIGAHQSGHAILYRSKKPVTMHQTLEPLLENGKINIDQSSFQIKLCFSYDSKYVVPEININRTIKIDEGFKRGHLINEEESKIIVLNESQPSCSTITIKLKERNVNEDINLYEAFRISVFQELIVQKPPKNLIKVKGDTTAGSDLFNKDWPVDNFYESVKSQTTNIPFALGCNHTDVCISNLQLDAFFLNAKNKYEYVVGSSRYIQLRTAVTNLGENGYLTQVLVVLPKKVYFKSINNTCENYQGGIKCHLANPLKHAATKYLNFEIDMSEIDNDNYDSNKLNFHVELLTSSNNTNKNEFSIPLHLKREADMELTGVSDQEFYYKNISRDTANFSQVFRLQKYGFSSVKQVLLEVEVPVRLVTKYKVIEFLKFYNYECTPKNISTALKKIKAFNTDDEQNLINPQKSYILNCTDSDIECCSIKMIMGPFHKKKTTANFDIKMLLNATCLADYLGFKETLKLQTFAKITIVDPINFVQTGNKSDTVVVSSIFTTEINDSIAAWIIILAILAGLLFLALAIYGLRKMGFFKRERKIELESMKKQVECLKQETGTVDTLDALAFETSDELAPIQGNSKLKSFKV